MHGHIQLDGESYIIDVRNYQRSLANAMAAKLGTGAGDYDDLQDWAAWLMDDWRAGAARKDPTAGGFLYGEADARFANQLTLPPQWNITARSTAGMRLPGSVTTTLTLDDDTQQRIAIKFTAPVNQTMDRIWVMVQPDPDVTVTLAIYSNNSGEPGTLLASGTIQSEESQPGWVWIGADVSQSLTASTVYWVVISADGSFTLPASPAEAGDTKRWDGSAWSNISGGTGWLPASLGFFYATDAGALSSAIVDIVRFNNTLYTASGTTLYKLSSGVWTVVGAATAAAVTDLQVWGGNLLIGLGDSTNYEILNTSDARSTASVPGRLFLTWTGLLYRAVENDLYYSADGSTWTGPLEMGPDDYTVRGLAGGDWIEVIASLDDGLMVLTQGDAVRGITPWGGIESWNGRGMINAEGTLYIPVGAGLVRMNASGGQMMAIGPDLGEGLPQLRQGRVAGLAARQGWLYAFLDANEAEGCSSLWAYTGESWVPLAILPAGMGAECMFWDRSTNTLYMGTSTGHIATITLPAAVENPLKDDAMVYAPSAWIETDWFSGNLKEVEKDVESVYLSAEGMGDGQTVTVYWQDDDSTGWELLTTFTQDRHEQRWPNTTRPATRQLRLALLLKTNSETVTPVVRAVRLKYLPMVTDRWRWHIVVRVADETEMLDGNVIDRTAFDQRGALQTAGESVAPVTFIDLDGREYKVKVEQMTETVGRYEYVHGAARYESFYRMTLLQV